MRLALVGTCPPWNPKREYLPPPQWAAPAVHQKLHKPFCRSFLEQNHRTVSCRVMAFQRQEPRSPGSEWPNGLGLGLDRGGEPIGQVIDKASLASRFLRGNLTLYLIGLGYLPSRSSWTVGAVARPPCTSSEDTVHSFPSTQSTRQRVLALSAPVVEPFHILRST